MLTWVGMIVPLFASIFLLIWHRKATKWWELLILWGITPIVIFSFDTCSEKALVTDTEYWGGIFSEVRKYEAWDEYIHQICTRTVSCGKNCTTTETYDCSYVDYHPEYFVGLVVYKTQKDVIDLSDGDVLFVGEDVRKIDDISKTDTLTTLVFTNQDTLSVLNTARFYTNLGQTIYIDEWQYKQLQRRFGNQQFVDMHRSYHSIDGDMYKSVWPGTKQTAEPLVTRHTYENRVKASSSVFNYPEVPEEDIKYYQLYQYPKIYHNYKLPTILGGEGLPDYARAEKQFNHINGRLGPKKQLRIWVLIYRNQTPTAADQQEALWKGGNKNEFVITIGIDSTSSKVQWCRPFSWSEVEEVKIRVRDFVSAQDTLDLVSVAKFVGPLLDSNFVRKQFADFAYLDIQLPLWQLIISWIITLVTNVGFSIWIVKNQFTDVHYSRNRY